MLLLLSFGIGHAQYYNGLKMYFGQNRVQYKPFNWRYYPYDNFDVYFYERGVNLGKYVADEIGPILKEYEDRFSVSFDEKIIFLIYNKISDFRQSNLGLENAGFNLNPGGKDKIIDNKVFIYFEGDHQKFDREIRAAIVRLCLNKLLTGKAFTDRLANSALLNVPVWFEEGFVSYFSQPYDVEVFNSVLDLVENNKSIKFNYLDENLARQVGHSFWYYIADQYSEAAILNILYFSSISKSIKSSIYFVLGISLKSVILNWQIYYEEKFNIKNTTTLAPDTELFKTKKGRNYNNLRVKLADDNIAFVENNGGKYKVFIYNTKTKKKKKIYKEGQKIEQIVDYSYPYIATNRTGKILSFTTEKESIVTFWTYNLDKQTLKSKILPYISKVTSFSYSPNGRYVVFSALANGYSDIFLFDMLSSQMQRLTFDLADDLNPVFSPNSNRIIFSSNRSNDTLKKCTEYEMNSELKRTLDLYYIDIEGDIKRAISLTSTQSSNETQVVGLKANQYMYLSDSSGVVSRYVMNFDSTISFVDTAVHYKYVSKSKKVSNYKKNIEFFDLNRSRLGEIIYDKDRYKMYKQSVNLANLGTPAYEQNPTYFREKYFDERQEEIKIKLKKERDKKLVKRRLDSLRPLYYKKIETPDSSEIDINNYTFEIEKDTLFRLFYEDMTENDSSKLKFPQMRVYHPTFYATEIENKFDFGRLNQTYQPFTGGPFVFNSGMSLFTTIGADELFNNYKLLAGFKWGFGGSMEYLFSVENLKKRTDRQLVYYRQTQNKKVSPYEKNKTKINQLMYILRYPFNQTSAVRASLIGKYDRNIFLSTEYNSLVKPDKYDVYAGAKFEYIFDNTKEYSLNIKEGMQFKAFSEFYQQVKGQYDYTVVLGADFRFYKKIFRNMIYAGRVAGSSSLGSGKILYYLGGVDEWQNLSFGLDPFYYFDKTVNINYDENYMFQAVATNMRGFKQNIRNGSNFAVINNEIRLPIIQVLANNTVNSAVFYNFQIVGFLDIGSAWNGWSPYDKRNIYNTIIVNQKPFTVIVDVERPPFVYSYGFGIRTKILGYFIRLDWGWGKEGFYSHPKQFHLSLGVDF